MKTHMIYLDVSDLNSESEDDYFEYDALSYCGKKDLSDMETSIKNVTCKVCKKSYRRIEVESFRYQ